MAWISIVAAKFYTLHVFDLVYSFEHDSFEESACPITTLAILKQIMNWETPPQIAVLRLYPQSLAEHEYSIGRND
jgi:hypothetical protein